MSVSTAKGVLTAWAILVVIVVGAEFLEAVGWLAAIASTVLVIVGFCWAASRSNAGARAHYQEERREVVARHAILQEQLTSFDDTLRMLNSVPYDLADPEPSVTAEAETVLVGFGDIALIDVSPSESGEPLPPVPVDVGSVDLTSSGVWFRGGEVLHWSFQEVRLRCDDDGTLFLASADQPTRGLNAPESLKPAVQLALTWLLGRATGTPPSSLRIRARATRESLLAAMPTHLRIAYQT